MTTRRSFLFRSVPSVAALSLGRPELTFALDKSGKQPFSDADADLSASELRPCIERFSTDRQLLQRYYNIRFANETLEQFRIFYSQWQSKLAKFNRIPHASRPRTIRIIW